MIIEPTALMAGIGEAMNLLNEVAERHPGAISFAAGRPADDLIGLTGLDAAVATCLEARGDHTGRALWQYGATAGHLGPLVREILARDEGVAIDPAAVIATTGAQEAMLLILAALFGPGDVLLVPDPCYVGITGAAAVAHIPIAPVAGLDAQSLTAAIDAVARTGRRARGLYLVPDFSNPLGRTLDQAQRQALIALAVERDLLLIEDSPYRIFAYDQPPPPSLLATAPAGRVIQLGSFAKALCPGLRVGWLVWPEAPPEAFAALLRTKSFVTLNTSPVGQALAEGVLRRAGPPSLRAAAATARAGYRARRDALCAALEARLSGLPGVRWERPEGGFFLTLHLPFDFDAHDMERCAATHRVLTCPMSIFSPTGAWRRAARLSFSCVDPALIREGVDRLARYVEARSTAC